MNNVLVTGGTGFIGSNLAERLTELGCNVRILRRSDSDLRAIAGISVDHRIGDVRDPESLRKAIQGCDTVFHTAAMVTFARNKKHLQHEVNVLGSRNVVEACLASAVERLVYTSSIAAIGHPPPGTLATEETPFNREPESGYRLSKHLAEKEILSGARKGLNAVIVNPSVVIGARDIHMHGGQLVKEAKQGHVLFYIEGGMNIVHVKDVVNGHILAAQKGRTGERYILGGHNMTHKEIFCRIADLVGGHQPLARLPIPLLRLAAEVIERVSSLMGIAPPISSDLVAGAGLYNWFSCEKAVRELGYTVSSFVEAVLSAHRWYEEHGFFPAHPDKPHRSGPSAIGME